MEGRSYSIVQTSARKPIRLKALVDSQWQGDMLVFDAGAAISLVSEQWCLGQDGRLPALRK